MGKKSTRGKGKKGRKGKGRKGKKKCSSKKCRLPKATMTKAIPMIKSLCRMKGDDIQALLPFLNGRARKVIYQCLYNCVFNNRIEESVKKELRRKLTGSERTVSYLANPLNSVDKKKKLLRQRGGAFLPIILSTLLPMLVSLFTKT
jgi:hypothetical protein